MHPKGTCSASLHCVGIGPYGGYTEVRQLAGGGVWSPRPTKGAVRGPTAGDRKGRPYGGSIEPLPFTGRADRVVRPYGGAPNLGV